MSSYGSGNQGQNIPDRLFQIFSATLSSDKGTRQSAEEALAQIAEDDPHFVLHLLEHACQSPTVCEHSFQTSPSATRSALHAGAIRFRNEVSRSDWNRNPHCPEDVKARVRELLVPLQCQPHVSEAVRRQLLAATVDIINVDYPDHWPQLLPQLTSLIEQSTSALRGLYETNSSHTREIDDDITVLMLSQLKGSLGVLRGCCKLYEDPLRVDADAADAFADQLAPSLVGLMELLTSRWQGKLTKLSSHGATVTSSGAAIAASFRFAIELEELAHCMRMTMKCIFSLFASRWPACLCEVRVLDYLYSTCVVKPIQVFQQIVLPLCQGQLEQALHHPSETGMTASQLRGDHFELFQQSPTFMLLKWVLNVAYKLTQEFASPKSCERRCREVAKHFSSQYLLPTVEAALSLVRWHAMPFVTLTSKAYILALEVLTMAVDHKAAYTTVLHPHAEELMTSLLFPRLAFTAEDEELWNDNPEEYVRKQTNPAGDIYSAKVVSTSLLMSLAVGTKKFHDKELFSSLVNFLLNQLQAYVALAAQASGDDADLYTPATGAARRVDATLYCFYHFKKVLLAMQFGDDKLEYVLSTFTVPMTQYRLGFLRARAVLVLSTFAPSMQWSSPQAYQQALQPVLGLLNDPEAPVRVQACVCFSRLVCHPYARDIINPCIAELIQHYFNVMRMMDNEAVVRTLRKTIAFYKDTLSQWALELTEMLVNHFAVVLERVTSKYNALESMTTSTASAAADGNSETFLDDDGFADVLMAADELLETLTTLVKALPESAMTQASRYTAAAAAHAMEPNHSAAPPSAVWAAAASSYLTPEALQHDIFVQIQLRVAPMLFVLLGHQGGSSYGFMDPALSLLTTLIARSPAIAPPMWKVLWCLHQLIRRGGAVDYVQQVLPPVDNFVSVEPISFLYHSLAELAREPLPSVVPVEDAAKTPAQLVFCMCEAVLASTSLREREVAAVPKMYDALLHNAWASTQIVRGGGGASAASPASLVHYVAQQALITAGTRAQLSPTFRALLANNIFSCFIVDVPTTLEVLNGLQATRAFLERYVMLLAQTVSVDGSDEPMLGLLRSYDTTLFVYAFVACLRCLAAEAAGNATVTAIAELQSSLKGVVQCGVLEQLAESELVRNTAELQVHKRRIAKLSGAAKGAANKSARGGDNDANVEDDEDEEVEEWDSEGSSEEDDDEWLNGDDDDEDEDDAGDFDDEDEVDLAPAAAGGSAGLSGDSRLQGMLRQAQALRRQQQQQQQRKGDGDDGDFDDFGEDNLLDDEDFSSPLDGVNAWGALVQEVERADGGAAARAVVALLRSPDCQAQAAAIVRARDITRELQAAREAHQALLAQSKS
jgi:importin-7